MRETLAVLRNRNMALLLFGRVVSTSGDWMYRIALMIAIYQYSHHQTYYIGIFWVVRLVPALVLGPFVGSLADRLGPKQAMLAADLGRMVLVLVLAFLLTPSTWVVIYPIVFAVETGSALFNPSSLGLIPTLVRSPAERLAANATISQAMSISIILGSAAGGIATGLGYQTLLLIDAVTFLVSAACLFFIRPRAIEASAEEEEEAGGGFMAGFRLLAGRPLMLFAAAAMAIPELASGALVIWFVPYSDSMLHLGSHGVGYLYASIGVGYVLGGFVAAGLGSNLRLDYLLAASVGVGGLAYCFFGAIPVAAAALAFVLVIGLAETVEYAAYETLLQQAVPESMIGRASGTMNSFLFNMMLIGNVISGFLAIWLGLPVAIVGLGIVTVVATVLAWIYLQRQTAGQPNADALARVPAFASVSPGIREWAVRRMVREQFASGAVVIRQGDEGDRFYTIARGTAEVSVVGEAESIRRVLGPGDFFGEIALLKNVPRTATVTAESRLTLWALSREDFDELQQRAGEFRESLLDIANARLAESSNVAMVLATRGT
jgi:MFS family permease